MLFRLYFCLQKSVRLVQDYSSATRLSYISTLRIDKTDIRILRLHGNCNNFLKHTIILQAFIWLYELNYAYLMMIIREVFLLQLIPLNRRLALLHFLSAGVATAASFC